MVQSILPKKIENSTNILCADRLKIKKPDACVLSWDDDWKNSITLVNGIGNLVFDFGQEMNGGIKIIFGDIECGEIKVHIRFGESRSEVNASIGEKNATNDHSPRDITATIPAFSETYHGNTGFRFVRIDFLENRKAYLQSVVCQNKIYRRKAIYIYNGNDETISKIFDAAKRTVDLCCSGKYLVDGIKRDRLVWVGDMHPEMLALTTLYGRVDKVEKSLDYMREITPEGKWMNGNYPAYSIWWIIIVADYCKMTGLMNFASKQLPYIDQLLRQMQSCIGENGELLYPSFFVDWATRNTSDEEGGMRALNIIAIKKAKWLFEQFGFSVKIADDLLIKLQKKAIIAEKMKQVIALKYFAEGTLSDSEYEKLIDGGAEGLSTFMSYYILSAIAARDPLRAVEIMKEYYGAMLEKGATTFWEDFNIEWVKNSCGIDRLPLTGENDIHGDFGDYCYKGFRHSLCHGWSAGVVKFIKEWC